MNIKQLKKKIKKKIKKYLMTLYVNSKDMEKKIREENGSVWEWDIREDKERIF